MQERIETIIPGRPAIELVSFYEEFRSYYPLCELETKRWFVDNVQPDWWIFDVGANVGYYSILFAQLAPKGRVVSFEPTSTARMLRENLRHNAITNVDVHEIALGAVTGTQQDRIFRLWGSEGDVQAYPFYRLDDFIAQHKPDRLDCIKIDVDSFDFEVLRGAEQTLLRDNPVIVVELNHALAKRNQSAGEALAWLAHQGYRQALVLDNDNFVLQRDRGALKVAGGKTMELVFPPAMRFDESIDDVAGNELASPIAAGELQNDAKFLTDRHPQSGQPPALSTTIAKHLASIRRLFPSRDDSTGDRGRLALSAIVGRAIESPAATWSYALALAFDSKVLAAAPPDASVVLEVGVEVTQGKLGLVISDGDLTAFASPERTLAAMGGTQRIVLTAPAAHSKSLVLRNVAAEGTRTIFTLASVRARLKPKP